MPPLFVSLRALYKNADKVALIEKMVVGYLTNIDASGRFTPEGEEESPTVVIWVLHFLAQHFDHLGQVWKKKRLQNEVRNTEVHRPNSSFRAAHKPSSARACSATH
jgi:peptide alpha-N-acetyltransferase